MQLPHINVNGTDRRELLDQLLKVKRTLTAAIDALQDAAPHGRDYQGLDPLALSRALSEHADRVLAVRKVRAEIETISEHVV